jgi:tRNA splicing endonuclease
MLFMVIEKFRNQDGKAVYAKLRDSGRGLPDGLKFVAS